MARPDAPQRSFRHLLPPIAVIATALVLASATFLVAEPDRVPNLTVVNRGDVAVTVDVGSGQRSGVLLLGTVEPRSAQISGDLLDQGSTWTFSFSAGNEDLGHVTVPRSVLARNNWRYVLPPAVLDRLSRTAQ